MAPSQPTFSEPAPGQKLPDKDFADVVRLTPLVSIDIVVRLADGRVLLGRRSNEPARGHYFTIGGRITKNETLAAAFRRITRGELGIEKSIDEAVFLGAYDHIYDSNFFEIAGFGTHYVSLGYELPCKLAPESFPVEQHSDFRLMTDAELLASPDVHENTKGFFRSRAGS